MASGNDMQAHEKTYSGFMSLLKWAMPAIALVAIFVIVQIAN
jgi:hypothetical protein